MDIDRDMSSGAITPKTEPVGKRLTEGVLKKLLESDSRTYYRTKELNDKLFLHYGGYIRMENLEPFTGLKVLYAECNSFETIEGLDACVQLRSLFLNQNLIRKIEGLNNLHDLWSLSLADNFIQKIENLHHLKKLNTLNLANNQVGLGGHTDVVGVQDSSITCLDLSNNKISDPSILDVLRTLPSLAVLYLKGNPVVKQIPNYRKSMILALPGLKFLDDRPVFPEERRMAEAWARGGLEAERQEKVLMAAEKETEYRRNADAFKAMIDEAKDNHRERQSMRKEDRWDEETDPVLSLERVQRQWYERHGVEHGNGEELHAGDNEPIRAASVLGGSGIPPHAPRLRLPQRLNENSFDIIDTQRTFDTSSTQEGGFSSNNLTEDSITDDDIPSLEPVSPSNSELSSIKTNLSSLEEME